MLTRAPRAVSDSIRNLVESIVPGGQPTFVEIVPRAGGTVNECFATVADQVAEAGGRIQHGWALWEWPGVLVEAEFHAVWVAPDNSLLCVTPRLDGERRILFLSEPNRVFSGELVDNVRLPLSGNPKVTEWITLAVKRGELRRKEQRSGRSNPRQASQELMTRITFQMRQLEREIADPRTPPISRNAPCPCGSGRPYKRCHGQPV